MLNAKKILSLIFLLLFSVTCFTVNANSNDQWGTFAVKDLRIRTGEIFLDLEEFTHDGGMGQTLTFKVKVDNYDYSSYFDCKDWDPSGRACYKGFKVKNMDSLYEYIISVNTLNAIYKEFLIRGQYGNEMLPVNVKYNVNSREILAISFSS